MSGSLGGAAAQAQIGVAFGLDEAHPERPGRGKRSRREPEPRHYHQSALGPRLSVTPQPLHPPETRPRSAQTRLPLADHLTTGRPPDATGPVAKTHRISYASASSNAREAFYV